MPSDFLLDILKVTTMFAWGYTVVAKDLRGEEYVVDMIIGAFLFGMVMY